MEAKEFLSDKLVTEYFRLLLVNFARYHVLEALKEASEVLECYPSEREQILNAYPLENIK